jgi:Fusaric acid resistance protein family
MTRVKMHPSKAAVAMVSSHLIVEGIALPYSMRAATRGRLRPKPTLSGPYPDPVDSRAITKESSVRVSEGLRSSADLNSFLESSMTTHSKLRTLMFAVRCSGAATLSYLVGGWIGLPHPIWATITALIISQERFEDTQSVLVSFLVGTCIGIACAVAVTALGSCLAAGVTAQLAVGVVVCAAIAHLKPNLRVCMWTCPLVLLTNDASRSVAMVAVDRGTEVVIGALIGAGLHWVAESRLLAILSQRLGTSTLVQ